MSGAKHSNEHTLAPRWVGRVRVLDALRLHGPTARVDIALITGMSPATVTAVTAELLSAGLIRAEHHSEKPEHSKRGRPRAKLEINPASAVVAGMKVGAQSITVLLTDFTGQEIGHSEHALEQRQFSPDDLRAQIITALKSACHQNQVPVHALSATVIGLAGYVDGAAGFVHWSSSLTKRSVGFASFLSEVMPCPVFIENDVNLVAKAEHLFGLGKGLESFLVATVEHGIGLGVVMNGVLHRGARGCGAEFGHTKITADGPLCQCGQRGCLEAYAGEYAVVTAANRAANEEAFGDFAAVLAAARQGNKAATDAISAAQRSFAIGLANLVNLFDPQEIIVASQIGAAHPLCASEVFAQVNTMIVQLEAPSPRLRAHGWDDLMWARGAAAQALEEVAILRTKAL